jgi:hypothetical protein
MFNTKGFFKLKVFIKLRGEPFFNKSEPTLINFEKTKNLKRQFEDHFKVLQNNVCSGYEFVTKGGRSKNSNTLVATTFNDKNFPKVTDFQDLCGKQFKATAIIEYEVRVTNDSGDEDYNWIGERLNDFRAGTAATIHLPTYHTPTHPSYTHPPIVHPLTYHTPTHL